MTKPRALFVSSLLVISLLLSCAGAPKPSPAPEPSPPAPAPQVSQPAPAVSAPGPAAPDELRAKATELRKRAFDLGLKDFLPQDYAQAETSFGKGSDSYGKDNAASAAGFTEAIDRYTALIDKGLPLAAESWRKKAQALKDTADSKSAKTAFPELYPSAQARYMDSADKEAAKDFDGAIAGYKDCTALFEILYKLCDAASLRDSIQGRELAKWDSSNWTLAQNKYQASQDLFRKDNPGSRNAVDEALLRYKLVVSTALGYYAADRKTATEDNMARAKSIKSEVAVQADYAAALALYQQGLDKSAAKDDEAAGQLFAKAATAFAAVYDKAKKKMDFAHTELDSLDAELATAGAAR